MHDYSAAVSEIKAHKFYPVYLCSIGNIFFWEKFIGALKIGLLSKGSVDFNYETIDGVTRPISEAFDSANQLPVFSDYRLVVLENFKMPKVKELGPLLSYIENPSKTTVLVIQTFESKLPNEFSRHAKKTVRVLKLANPYEKDLPGWITQIAKEYDKKVDPRAVEYFINFVGNDLKKIDLELSKLCAYVGERDLISVKDIDDVVSDTKIESLFAFIDCISGKHLSEGLSMLQKMIVAGELHLKVVSMLSRHYRILWKIKKRIVANLKGAEIANELGIHPYFISKYIEDASLRTFPELKRALGLIAKTDVDLKTVPISKDIILEKLCIDLARL
jgi:DNA polymerase III subunit delta